MTTTKHEEECCEVCILPDGSCKNPTCINCHAEPTGAGMEERFEEQFKDWKFHHEGLPCFNDALVKVAVLRFIDSELSRLHSRIIEEVEKEKKVIEFDKKGDDYLTGVDVGLDKVKTIVNQAFKDL